MVCPQCGYKDDLASTPESPALRSTLARVAVVLLETAGRNGGGEIMPSISGIATFLNTTPRLVYDSLLLLSKKDIIELKRKRIIIKDEDALCNVAFFS